LCVVPLGFSFSAKTFFFFLYGYEQSLIRTYTVESFMAFRKIADGKWMFLVISMLLSFGLFISSYFARKKLFGVYQLIVSIFLYVSFIVSIIFLIVFSLSFIIPKKIF
jgi:hypothetical protein